ncbi:MAG: succinate dehydrogenase assembly factor 2 [Methylococcus sp.]|nr:MAG: succinate dehydrogenase assembly factor 2 [Chloroflexota bacterium]RUM51945.1 MAG: succinate dehydrogenase assembly factor 2 [Methylococcus sp.]
MANRSKLQWLCRRGSLELDIILSRYLERCYDEAPAAEQFLFEALLDLPDTELQRFFIGGQDPIDGGILKIVRTIRSLSAITS